MSKIVMIVAQKVFRDEELFVTRLELEKQGHIVKVASRKLEICQGKLGGTVMPDMTIYDIQPADFDAIIYVGGSGASEYFDDKKAHGLAREFFVGGKTVAAICIAPVILANAGLLSGVRATVFSSGAQDLRHAGAIYTGEQVTSSGRIITGNGPDASVPFARAVSASLTD